MSIQIVLIDFRREKQRDTVLLHVQSSEGMKELQGVFRGLAEARVREVNLCSQSWVKCAPSISSFVARLVQARGEPSRTLRTKKDVDGRFMLEWSRHSDGWLENMELLEGLCWPAHQYLDYGSSGASIEVTTGQT